MSPQSQQPYNPQALLAWYVAMGADEAVGDITENRFAPAPKPAQADLRHTISQATAATQAEHGAQATLPNKNIAPAPRPVAAKPAQAPLGAGEAEAQKTATACTSLAELEEAMKNFNGGVLKASAKNTVFADGVAGSELMLVGEAPGADEDRLGKPFVGVSGQLLDKMLDAAGFDRTQNAYISNIVPWRPLGNRTPDQAVVTMCLPFIRRHIELAAPKVVLLVGGVSAKAILETEEGITRLRGKWRDVTTGNHSFAALPIYHPAYLLRQPHLKGAAWRDLLSAREKLGQS